MRRLRSGSCRCLASVMILFSCGGKADSPASLVPGPPTRLSIRSGDGQTTVVGTLLPIVPTVVAKDANGNDVPAVAIVFQVGSGGGIFSGGQATWESVTDASGVATAPLWILGPNEGANTMIALASGIPPVTIRATAVSGTGSTLVLDEVSARAGDAVPVKVEVRDPAGQMIVGTLPSTLSLSSKLLGRFDSVVCTNGRCATIYAPTAAGHDSVYAKIGGQNITNSPFAFTVFAGEPAKIGVVSQPLGIAENGIALPRQPIVQLQDQFSNPAGRPGLSVTVYQLQGSGPGSLRIENDTTRTDTSGVQPFRD